MALPWFPLPASLVQDGRLTRSQVVVLWAVRKLTKELPGKPVGAPGIARVAGVATSTAQIALARLIEVGLLRKEGRGNGLAAFYTEVPQEVHQCPAEFRRTCPNSGRCLPAVGEVGCRLAASYLAIIGRVNGGDHKRERDSEREDSALSPDTIQLGEEIRSRTGLHLSRKQLAFLEPAFRSGVPLGLALELAGTWAVTESPWGFAGRLQAAWGEVVNDARALGVSRQNGVPHGLPAERVERVRRHGKPEHVQWAFGEGERG